MSTSVSIPVFSGVPSFFRACCREASSQSYGLSFSHPGHELMRHVLQLSPYGCDGEEWQRECEVLDALCEAAYDDPTPETLDKVADWFVAHYPRCMALVPVRRRQRFAQGAVDKWADSNGAE